MPYKMIGVVPVYDNASVGIVLGEISKMIRENGREESFEGRPDRDIGQIVGDNELFYNYVGFIPKRVQRFLLQRIAPYRRVHKNGIGVYINI